MTIQATYVSLHITTHYTSEHTSTYTEQKRASESRQRSREAGEKGQPLAMGSMPIRYGYPMPILGCPLQSYEVSE